MNNEITLDKIHEILDQCTTEEQDTFTDYVVLWVIWLMMVCVAIIASAYYLGLSSLIYIGAILMFFIFSMLNFSKAAQFIKDRVV
jgi:hypothetical protein